MYQLTCNVQIGGFEFTSVNEVQIRSSWENLTDTATIQIARKLQWEGKSIVDLIKRGDPVNISLGYDYDNKELFVGYVSRIYPGVPLKIECEDVAYKLKTTEAKASGKWPSYKQVDLKKLLSDICPVPFDSISENLGQFRISNVTVAQVLEEIKKSYGTPFWCRDGKLYAGLLYIPTLQKTHYFRVGYNVIDDSGLEYQTAANTKAKVKLISILPGNQKVSIEAGDTDGQLRTLHYTGKTEADLRAIADRELKKIKYDGYSGSFVTFGDEIVRHGDIINLSDNYGRQEPGKYLVKSVEYSFGFSGYRQKIELDKRA